MQMPTCRVVLWAALSLGYCFAAFARTPETSLVLYVSPDGRDSNSGDRRHPIATLEGARTRARQIRSGHTGMPLEVIIAQGVYELSSSFTLNKQDGGDSLAPVTYRAANGGTVRLTGGRSIRNFRKVTDQSILQRWDPACAGNVLECNLRADGITEFGSLRARGFGRPISPSHLELFVGNKPMTLAQWPNNGWALIADTIARARDSAFVYSGDRPSRWREDPDIWMHGYWTWDWADSYTRVAHIDTTRKVITTVAPHGVYGYTPGKRFVALNIIEELDEPGEYYVDRTRGVLYFWPPAPFAQDEVTVSMLESPLIILNNTSWVTFAGFTIECTRGAGVEIIGGNHNTVAGCTIRNIGTVAVSIGALVPEPGQTIYDGTLYNGKAGHDNGVQSCEISQCGEGGVILCGGDRATLLPGHNFVDNCHITDCCRWSRTYRAGVYIWGVGNRLTHSVIHNLPHTAAFFWGNDHLLEYNEIYDVCKETGDAGAFYQGRDWSQRGNRLQYNYFHDLRGVQGQQGFTDVMSIYMDDFASGTTVFGNVFVNGGRSVMIGGGRDNLVENNLFVDCHPSIHVDARGRGWAAFMVDGTNSVLYVRLKAVRHTEPPYSSHYRRLATILDEAFALPEGNVICHNISYGGTWRELLDGVTDSLVAFRDNFVDTDPGFASAIGRDFHLRPDAQAFKGGFQRVPVSKIGLYNDAYRRNIPHSRKDIPGGMVSE